MKNESKTLRRNPSACDRRHTPLGQLSWFFGAFCLAVGVAAPQPANAAIEQVTVTAQKREQSILEVPIAVSNFSGTLLEERGYTRLGDVAPLVPNFEFQQPGDARFLRLSIRGISADSRFPGAEQSVGVVVDGVFLSGVAGMLTDLVDIDRIEVLRGPQGTLFGRNTTGGVLQIITRQPTNEFRATASAEYDNFDHFNIKASVSGPLVQDKVFAGLALSHTQRDGFDYNPVLDTDFNDQDTTTIRGTLRFLPTEDLEIRLSGDVTFEDRSPSMLDGVAYPPAVNPIDRVVPFDTPTTSKRDIYGGALTIIKDFSNGISLKSITSYREYKVDETIDGDSTPVFAVERNNLEKSKEFTQELQLLSPSGQRLEWVLGAFYLHQDLSNLGVTPNNTILRPAVLPDRAGSRVRVIT